MKRIIFVLFLVVFGGLPMIAQQDFESCLSFGVQAGLYADLSEQHIIEIEQPRCAFVNITSIDKLPTMKDDNLNAWLEYYDGNGHYFKKRVILNAQGNSSLYLPKQNLSVDFVDDEWIGDSVPKITFGNWVSQGAFHLKANYTDYFRCIGTIGYSIYDDMVSDHDHFLDRANIVDPNARCYPAGFPCIVYLNGDFYGIYAWQLKKHRDNMAMKKRAPTHVYLDGTLGDVTLWDGEIQWKYFKVRNPKGLYCSSVTETSEGLTYAAYDGDSPQELIDESMEYYNPSKDGHVLSATVKHSIEKLASYCGELKEYEQEGMAQDAMRQEIANRFDVTSMLDYMIFGCVFANHDGFNKNWQWFTYDGEKWFVAPYDLDCTFGCFFTGAFAFPAEWTWYNAYYQWLPQTGPCYFFCTYFFDDIKARYAQLRQQGNFDVERVLRYITDWSEAVGSSNYTLEYQKWDDCGCNRDLIVSEGWQTVDDWTGYSRLEPYSETTTYSEGDKCKLDYRVWIATRRIRGVKPYQQLGFRDSLPRYHDWFVQRQLLIDIVFGYPHPQQSEYRQELSSDTVRSIKDISGFEHSNLVPGINIVIDGNGGVKKIYCSSKN